ncbi:MAG: hypothetical protein LQ343_000680 [Gyalolechia ehrenbergii]|nr:MAG: hypothetical protein LQ343_000680 [Gyalolechia ehrenbergii]
MSAIGAVLPSTELPQVIGQEAPEEIKFCPLAAVSKWPYKSFGHLDSEIISKAFFAAGKFRMRGWSLYYIYTLLDTANKPLVLVPASEVQALFDDIKSELRLLVYFPSVEKEPGFLLSFTEKGIPRPRYLGRLDLEHSLDEMEAKIPPFTHEVNDNPRIDDRSFAAFKKKMEEAVQAMKQKSKFQKNKKKKERITLKQSWCEQMKRAQCYLGVRPRKEPGMRDPASDPSIPIRELEQAVQRYNLSQCIELPDLDISEPAPFEFRSNVVFICVDVEAYEKNERPITEIGISTLDTSDLIGLPPGEVGKTWMKKIRTRHFRIKETAHLHNSEFVAGCADRFEPEFGESEWISFKDAPQVIASCFRPPYSRPLDHLNGGLSNDAEGTPEPKRKLVLVGHDIKNDIHYLRKLGYDVSNLSNLIEALDTADLYRAWKHQLNPSKLGSILVDLELTGWNLHNAGNDAAYTLQSLIGIAIFARTSGANRQLNTQAHLTAHAEILEREARDRAKEEADEWAVADMEGGDGGAPKPLERFGWPTDDLPTGSRQARKGANVSEARDSRKELEAKLTVRVEGKENEGIVKGKEVGDANGGETFSQSMSERLVMLEKVDGKIEGGVKLPVTTRGF